ncbi:MAG TPA: hypothetical protein VKC59_07050 [Candidatus Limnocylindrales bacterium]|nr:hypothetical protein [Candidatus Limnocylindrales bacterium]
MTSPQERPRADEPSPPSGERRARIDPAALPMPISRRRLATVAGLLAAGWLVVAFGRQVGAASAATDRADELRGANAALRRDVTNLQDDLARVQDGRFVQLMGRAYGLGGRGEVAFTLEAGAPSPGPDAPGSAAVRLGARPSHGSPLDGWLSTLFGPGS